MKKIICMLECGHEIEWADRPGDPGADLPFIGRDAYCPECEADIEITEMVVPPFEFDGDGYNITGDPEGLLLYVRHDRGDRLEMIEEVQRTGDSRFGDDIDQEYAIIPGRGNGEFIVVTEG